jgi:hypothetical protein
MYQQIQGLNTEEKGLKCDVSNTFVRYEYAKLIQQN